MVRQQAAAGNGGVTKRRGRPPRMAAAQVQEMGHAQAEANKDNAPKVRFVSDFQKDMEAYGNDPVVRQLWLARKKLFNMGEDTNSITKALNKRVKTLKDRGNLVH